MQDYSELVEALRLIGKEQDCNECEAGKWHRDINCCLFEDAADAIEALLKENKELIEDRPEMVEADGHWEWRKPNGEVLLPKRGEIVRCKECIHFTQGGWCDREFDWFPVEENDFCSMAEKMEVQE